MTSNLRKLTIGVAAAATIAGGIIASATSADAQYRRYHRGPSGGAVAAGVIGGLALGAAAAAAASRPAYGYPAYGYAPAYAPACWYEPRVVGYDRWGNERVRNVRVCN